MSNNKKTELTLIPKSENYVQYMIEVIFKLPRTEKLSIGTEYKSLMYKMLENIILISKILDEQKLNCINIFKSIKKKSCDRKLYLINFC